jgi:hypothetical protein
MRPFPPLDPGDADWGRGERPLLGHLVEFDEKHEVRAVVRPEIVARLRDAYDRAETVK